MAKCFIDPLTPALSLREREKAKKSEHIFFFELWHSCIEFIRN